MSPAAPVDAYLAALPPDQRAALERIRRRVAQLAPQAIEMISYGMPTLKLGDRSLLWYAGWKAHCSVYPLTDSFSASHGDALKGYRRTRGSLHFTPDQPLPDPLLTELVRARLADLQAETGE